MSDAKCKVLRKINLKASRMEDLKVELANRNKNIETFILTLLEELDYNLSLYRHSPELTSLPYKDFCVGAVERRIKIVDANARAEVTWGDEDQTRPDGILVRWSTEYQIANNCEPELYVDVAGMMLKD